MVSTMVLVSSLASSGTEVDLERVGELVLKKWELVAVCRIERSSLSGMEVAKLIPVKILHNKSVEAVPDDLYGSVRLADYPKYPLILVLRRGTNTNHVSTWKFPMRSMEDRRSLNVEIGVNVNLVQLVRALKAAKEGK
ncbi:hypothetical protein [Luteolibacter marinus]|uniref:hypothetical protein n=1 Tax=Luteolibacter marinus TaxID=2776705 RepID=UPI0018693CA9|nr:hypothetical protein [Luteolibacter marinus]